MFEEVAWALAGMVVGVADVGDLFLVSGDARLFNILKVLFIYIEFDYQVERQFIISIK